MKTHTLTAELFVPLEREQVFSFFADAGNLERVTPKELNFRILTPQPMAIGHGSLIDYRLSLYGLPFRWKTRIALWDPPNAFSDEQLTGPYKSWHHRHEFLETDGGTRIRDTVQFSLPLSPLSEVVLPLIRAQVRRIFTYRQEAVKRVFGGEGQRWACSVTV